MARVLCGVPAAHCNGGTLGVKNGPGKTHASSGEAFDCHAAHLVAQGYVRVGGREFEKDGGPIRVLNKRSKFGARVRWGKERTRVNYYRGRNGSAAGTIVGC